MENWHHTSVQELLESSGEEDPSKVVRSKARNTVFSAYKNGWSGPPFDPLKLAKLLGITVRPNDNLALDATIFKDDEETIIEYNPNQRLTRINFSIAHEIAHTFFPDWARYIRNREAKSNTEERELEFLCDIGAAEILLPYGAFIKKANKVELTIDSLIALADKFQASLESVFLRFCEVVNKPCAVAIASRSKKDLLTIDYFKKSGSFDVDLYKNDKVPKDSNAYECIKPGWTSHKPEKWPQFKDNEVAVYSIGLPPLKRTTNLRVGLFFVPAKKYEEIFDNRIITYRGDATKPRGEGNKIIVQVVNDVAALGSGFGKAMANQWPKSKDNLISRKKEDGLRLGDTFLVELTDNIHVFQIVAQEGIKPSTPSTVLLDYESLATGLRELSKIAKKYNATLHMPLIGTGQAGGNWEVIEGMIYDELVYEGNTVCLYILPSGNPNLHDLSNQGTLFE